MTEFVTQLLVLLEKMAVIATAAFILAAARPFQTLVLGRRSWLRGVAIVLIFSLLSIWGSHLGFEILGVRANNRAVGILVAGLLGGPLVGPLVGLVGGLYIVLAFPTSPTIAPLLVVASTLDGLLAGIWGTRHRASQLQPALAFLVALAVQAIHLVVVGVLLVVLDSPFLQEPLSSHLGLLPEILENALSVALFVAIMRTSLRLREAEVALSRQEAAAAQARLQALQAQIRPHFLFNALSTISYLIRTEPEQARTLLGKLAAMYRHLLRSSDQPVPLADELAQVERYLEIEKARFGERLQVSWEVEPTVRQAALPSLLLQPVVENAVKHGLSPRPTGGHVHIRAGAEGEDWLLLEVADDGLGYDGERRGTGLTNVAERVAAVGAGLGSLRIEGGPGRGTRVLIRIPLRRLPDSQIAEG